MNLARALPTDSEEFRRECECRYVANLPTNRARQEYLGGVARHRGEAAAARLRRDAWEVMRAAA